MVGGGGGGGAIAKTVLNRRRRCSTHTYNIVLYRYNNIIMVSADAVNNCRWAL